MTKPITSVALMQLYERGLFQLNDPVYRVLPEWRNQKVYVSGEGETMELAEPERPMTFRHLLSHTAGLSYGGIFAAGREVHPVDQLYEAERTFRGPTATLNGLIQHLADVPLRYQPGEMWMYSLATDVCGLLVERMSGQTLDQYLRDHILGPLGMNDTGFSVAPEKAHRFAANYERAPDKSLRLIDDPETSHYLKPPNFRSGGGGLISTTADYLRFCEMLRCHGRLGDERILGARTLELMWRNHLPGGADLGEIAIEDFSETAYEGVGFGLGFATTLDTVQAGTLGAGDVYWGGAASTIFWVDPIEDLSVVFMTQLMPSATFNFRGQLKNIIYGALDD
jgi:CubicO group peptidase (beta-lactamase class C family)